MRTRAVFLATIVVALGPALTRAHAQAPPATPAPSAPQPAAMAEAATHPAGQPAAEAYSYNPDGRRDPFVSLLARGTELSASRENRPGGRDGLTIGEVSVRGIMRTRSSFVAMVQGPDNKTYIIHPGDKMLDGVVKAIAADVVVFSQDVNDPLSLVKQREVRKALRTPEEGK